MLGDKLRDARERKHITQVQLAHATGMSGRSIFRYEKNEGIPSNRALERIAAYLDVTVDYLLDDSDIKNAPDEFGNSIESEYEQVRMSLWNLLENPELTDDDVDTYLSKVFNIFMQAKHKRKMARSDNLGARIKALREQHGWTQAELGERVGMAKRTVGTWESGLSVIKPSLRQPLADALGVTIDELFGDLELT